MNPDSSSLFVITLGLELRDTKVSDPWIRALLRTASQNCEAVVLQSRTVPFGIALGSRILLVVRRGAQAMYNQFDKRGGTVIPLGGNVGGARGAAVTPLGGTVGGTQAKLSAPKQQP